MLIHDYGNTTTVENEQSTQFDFFRYLLILMFFSLVIPNSIKHMTKPVKIHMRIEDANILRRLNPDKFNQMYESFEKSMTLGLTWKFSPDEKSEHTRYTFWSDDDNSCFHAVIIDFFSSQKDMMYRGLEVQSLCCFGFQYHVTVEYCDNKTKTRETV